MLSLYKIYIYIIYIMSGYKIENPNAAYFSNFYSAGSIVRVKEDIEHTNYFYE